MIRRCLAALVVVLVLATPASAHSLRVFVTAEGPVVRGYGFFVGGGRPRGADWRAEAGDVTLAQGITDSEGAFGFVLPGPVAGDIVVTIDPGDGHVARATLARGRIGMALAQSPSKSPAPSPSRGIASDGPLPPGAADRPAPATGSTVPPSGAASTVPLSPATGTSPLFPPTGPPTPSMPDAAAIEAAVDRAVARQVEPILIRLEEMDARLRLTDLVSGGLAIFGLAGVGLWLRGRGQGRGLGQGR